MKNSGKNNKYHRCLLFLVLLFGIIPLNTYYKFFAVNSNSVSGECSFRIMTYNVNASDSVSFTQAFQDSLLSLISKQKPDIICFQELSFTNLKKIKPQLDSIYGTCDILKGDNQLWRLRFYSHFPLRNFRRHHCEGDMDLTDVDSSGIKRYQHLKRQMPVMSAEFEVQPGKWIRLYSGHLCSSAYSTARRSMDKDAHWWEGVPLYLRNYRIGKRIRNYQAKNVRRFVDETLADCIPVIVAGDLNDWCGSTTVNTLMGEGDNALRDAWWEGGNGFGFTYQGWHLRLRLDHILYSNGFVLQEVKVIDSELSDHRPLVADFVVTSNK